MIHSRCTYEKTNRLHERALRIVFDNYESTFDKRSYIFYIYIIKISKGSSFKCTKV